MWSRRRRHREYVAVGSDARRRPNSSSSSTFWSSSADTSTNLQCRFVARRTPSAPAHSNTPSHVCAQKPTELPLLPLLLLPLTPPPPPPLPGVCPGFFYWGGGKAEEPRTGDGVLGLGTATVLLFLCNRR